MTSQQSKKYTLGEVSIIVENIDTKLNEIKEETKEQFTSLGKGMDKLSGVLADVVKNKAENDGAIRATKVWITLIVTSIMAVSGFVFKLMLNDITSTIISQTDKNDDETYHKMTEWVNANYQIKK